MKRAGLQTAWLSWAVISSLSLFLHRISPAVEALFSLNPQLSMTRNTARERMPKPNLDCTSHTQVLSTALMEFTILDKSKTTKPFSKSSPTVVKWILTSSTQTLTMMAQWMPSPHSSKTDFSSLIFLKTSLLSFLSVR